MTVTHVMVKHMMVKHMMVMHVIVMHMIVMHVSDVCRSGHASGTHVCLKLCEQRCKETDESPQCLEHSQQLINRSIQSK